MLNTTFALTQYQLRMKRNFIKTISVLVLFYMVVALSWWTILLVKKNAEVYQAKVALVEVEKASTNTAAHVADLRAKKKRQETMIIGEGVFLALSLLIGMLLIQSAYQKQYDIAQRQRNFLLSVTHELKSPIASIKLVFDTMMRRKRLDESQVVSLAESGQHESDRLYKLVENLLMAARIDGAHKYNFQPINAYGIIDGLLVQYRKLYESYTFTLKGDSELLIYADPSAFTIVANNLIDNAIKYRSPNRPVDVLIAIAETNNHVTISFTDNGVGIPETYRQAIFDKFFRIGDEEKRKTQGTGLGLFIVKRIIDAHKGQISVKSKEHDGSQFVTTWTTPK